jgi:hypothetical protein
MTNRPATTVSALLVYVSALVGGYLHHHDALAAPDAGKLDREVAACSEHDIDDGHDCAICNAIAQARVQPPSTPSLAFATLWQPATILPCDSPDLTRHNTSQARAPPV